VILVTVGTSSTPFDRLLRAVDGFGDEEALVVQHGPSPVRPRGAACMDSMPFEELTSAIGAARVVVTHAGVGTVLACLGLGRVPVVVPRLASLGEAVDDHQLELGRRLAGSGLVTLVEDESLLSGIVAELPPSPGSAPRGRRLAHDLRGYLAACVEPDQTRVDNHAASS
jgi:UDP-N-acetylglucosamine transferase subunit ALG13